MSIWSQICFDVFECNWRQLFCNTFIDIYRVFFRYLSTKYLWIVYTTQKLSGTLTSHRVKLFWFNLVKFFAIYLLGEYLLRNQLNFWLVFSICMKIPENVWKHFKHISNTIHENFCYNWQEFCWMESWYER